MEWCGSSVKVLSHRALNRMAGSRLCGWCQAPTGAESIVVDDYYDECVGHKV